MHCGEPGLHCRYSPCGRVAPFELGIISHAESYQGKMATLGVEQGLSRMSIASQAAGLLLVAVLSKHPLLEEVPVSPARYSRSLCRISHPSLAYEADSERRPEPGTDPPPREAWPLCPHCPQRSQRQPSRCAQESPPHAAAQGDWYKIVHFPDRRFRNPMGETDPATKIELSRHFAAGYLLTNLLQAEPAVDDTVELLLGWLAGQARRRAQSRRPGPLLHVHDL